MVFGEKVSFPQDYYAYADHDSTPGECSMDGELSPKQHGEHKFEEAAESSCLDVAAPILNSAFSHLHKVQSFCYGYK